METSSHIPFNNPSSLVRDFIATQDKDQYEIKTGHSANRKILDQISKLNHSASGLLVPSCTAGLELAALALNISVGDEIIIPSNTFVSTANAFVLRGGIPVFVDCDPDTLNIDPTSILKAITNKTKAIVPVHYAGVSCDMAVIMQIADEHGLAVIEDAAQAFGAFYKNQHLGSIGQFGTYSFHYTKNLSCGEGGAISINDSAFIATAQMIQEKGTDRFQFLSGKIDKYTWQTAGSSYLLAEPLAQILLPQIFALEAITEDRRASWDFYHSELEYIESLSLIQRPKVPSYSLHNAHMYYVLLDQQFDREIILHNMNSKGIGVCSHYVPLDTSPAGKKFGRTAEPLQVTHDVCNRLIRLPLFYGIDREDQRRVIETLAESLEL